MANFIFISGSIADTETHYHLPSLLHFSLCTDINISSCHVVCRISGSNIVHKVIAH